MLSPFHPFQQSERWTSASSLTRSHESLTSEASEWQGDSRQVLHACQMSGVVKWWKGSLLLPTYTASECPTLKQDAMALRNRMWLHVVAIPLITRAHCSTFLTTPSLSPNSLWVQAISKINRQQPQQQPQPNKILGFCAKQRGWNHVLKSRKFTKMPPMLSTLKVQTLDLGRKLVSYGRIKVAWRYLSLYMVNLRINGVNSTKTSF